MNKAAVLAVGGYPDWDIAAMAEGFELVRAAAPAMIGDLAPDLRARIRVVALKGHDPFSAQEMDALPALGLIANYGVGYDAIDIAAARARGIRVSNTPEVLTDDVADLAVGMMIAFDRRIPQGESFVRAGRWAAGEAFALNRAFSGRKAGIIGLGRIGRAIAERLAAFRMEIHHHSRTEKQAPAGWVFHADPASLARAVDWVVVALAGGPQTRGYVSAEVIGAMRPDAALCNISRGSTLDEAALLDALEQGRIRGAALDVFLTEPQIDPRFLALPNVLLQPHQGSGSIETRKAMGALQRANISAFLEGRPLPAPVA